MNLKRTFFIYTVFLLYGSMNASAQCGASIAITPGADCSAPSKLKLNAPYAVQSIDWQLANTSVQMRHATWEESGTIVAGGNGRGTQLDQMVNPSAVFVYRDTLFVTEFDGHRATKWVPGATSGVLIAGNLVAPGNNNGKSGATLKELNHPLGIFRDREGNILISEYDNARVLKWKPGAAEGELVAGKFPTSAGNALTNLNKPTEIYLDKKDTLYIVEQEAARVTKWALGETTGVLAAGISAQRSKTDFTKFSSPIGLGVDEHGNMYVSDEHKVLEWLQGSTMGTLVAGTLNGNGEGKSGSDAASFNSALSVRVDKWGNLYVSDNGNHRIQRWLKGATTGETIIGGRGAGSLPTYPTNVVWGPRGIHLDSNGNIFVTEWNGHRVTKFRPMITDTFLAAVSGTYRAIVTGFNGCTDTITVTVTGAGTAPVPTVSASGPLTFCNGDSVILTSSTSKGVTYRWKNGGDIISGATKSSVVVKTAGNYIVEIVDGACATASAVTTVTVHALPDVKAGPADASACKGKSVTLTASGAATYSWSPAAGLNTTTGNSVIAGPATTTTYTITGRDANNCVNTATKTVNVLLLPEIKITATQPAVCLGDTTTLTASGAVSYTWNPAPGLVNTGGAIVKAGPVTNTRYLVTGVGANGCSDTVSAIIPVHALPVATIVPGGTQNICSGDSVVLNAGTWAAYQWEKDGIIQPVVSGNYTALDGGSYRAIVTDGNHCSGTSDTVTVIRHALPVVTVTPGDTAFCAGSQLVLNALTTDTGISYQWKNAQGDISNAVSDFYQVSASGTYKVLVNRKHVLNCRDSSAPVNVTIHPLPQPVIEWDTVALRTAGGYTSYQWSVSEQNIPGATDSAWTPVGKGNYQVTVTDTNGCSNVSAVFPLTSLSVELPATDAVHIYPNPAGEVLYIKSPVPVTIRISNIEGRQMLTGMNTRELNINNLPAGLYWVMISDEAGKMIKMEKLLKTAY